MLGSACKFRGIFCGLWFWCPFCFQRLCRTLRSIYCMWMSPSVQSAPLVFQPPVQCLESTFHSPESGPRKCSPEMKPGAHIQVSSSLSQCVFHVVLFCFPWSWPFCSSGQKCGHLFVPLCCVLLQMHLGQNSSTAERGYRQRSARAREDLGADG